MGTVNFTETQTAMFTILLPATGLGGPYIPSDQFTYAKSLVDLFAANEEYIIFQYNELQIDLAQVLHAMLHHVRDCGGKAGERYTASSILKCRNSDKSKTFEMLRKLAKTWLCRFLFTFYTSAYHPQPENRFSWLQSPLRENEMDQGDSQRSTFRDKLLLCDGYRCVITHLPHIKHPVLSKSSDPDTCDLNVSYIVPHAIADCYSQKDEEASARVTLNIFRKYVNLSEQEMKRLHKGIDDPSNGLMTRIEPHWGFNTFCWCFQETNTPDKYTVKMYNGRHGIHDVCLSDEVVVDFKDHSAEFEEGVRICSK